MLRPLPSSMRATATTPAEPVGACVARFPTGASLPRFHGGSASALSVSGPARRSLVLRPAWSLSRPWRPVASECFRRCRYLHHPLRLLPAGATVAGRDSHPLKNGAHDADFGAKSSRQPRKYLFTRKRAGEAFFRLSDDPITPCRTPCASARAQGKIGDRCTEDQRYRMAGLNLLVGKRDAGWSLTCHLAPIRNRPHLELAPNDPDSTRALLP